MPPINIINNFVKNVINVYDSTSQKGRLVSFHYQFFKHDPFPVILTTGLMGSNKIGGLNIHYLTFPVYRALLNSWAGNNTFNYYIIKNEPLIKQAFRSYKLNGIKNAKLIEWKSIIEVLSIIRNYSPQEIQKIQQFVDQQVASRQPEIINELFNTMINNFNENLNDMSNLNTNQANKGENNE